MGQKQGLPKGVNVEKLQSQQGRYRFLINLLENIQLVPDQKSRNIILDRIISRSEMNRQSGDAVRNTDKYDIVFA